MTHVCDNWLLVSCLRLLKTLCWIQQVNSSHEFQSTTRSLVAENRACDESWLAQCCLETQEQSSEHGCFAWLTCLISISRVQLKWQICEHSTGKYQPIWVESAPFVNERRVLLWRNKVTRRVSFCSAPLLTTAFLNIRPTFYNFRRRRLFLDTIFTIIFSHSSTK
jgi:hypothetical protein